MHIFMLDRLQYLQITRIVLHLSCDALEFRRFQHFYQFMIKLCPIREKFESGHVRDLLYFEAPYVRKMWN